MSVDLFVRSPSAMFEQVGSDVVALHVQNGRCYGMEEVTAAIWGLLAKPIGISAICDHLLESYDVAPAECRTDVEDILDRLRAEGLVETANAGRV